MWDSLKEIALIGTDKRTFDVEELPPAIRAQLDGSGADQEELFLKVLTFTSFYVQAGHKLPYSGNVNREIIAEEQEVTPIDLVALIPQIEQLEYAMRTQILPQWLQILEKYCWRVPSEHIIRLLQLVENQPKYVRRLLTEVIGNRGKWVLQFLPGDKYQFEAVAKIDNVWEEGTLDLRKKYFADLRQEDPQRAIELLQLTWQTESIVVKRAFLELIRQSVVPEDMAFLTACYEQEFGYKPKEKKTERECREIVALALLALPESSLARSTSASLRNYIITQKTSKMFGLMADEKTTLQLPSVDQEDAFWNQTQMIQTYGFSNKFDLAQFADLHQYWLSLFVSSLPLKFWIEAFGGNLALMLTTLLSDPFRLKTKNASLEVLLPVIFDNLVRNPNLEVANALLSRFGAEVPESLLRQLDVATFEKFIRKNNYETALHLLMAAPVDQFWSLAFTEQVIEKVSALFEASPYQIYEQFGRTIARFAALGVAGFLDKKKEKLQNHPRFNHWERCIYDPINATIHIKKTLAKYA